MLFSGDRIQVLDAQRAQDSCGSAAPLSHGLLVLTVAKIDVHDSGPSLDHHQAHQDLAIPWFSIPTMSMQGKSYRTVALEVGGSQIVYKTTR